MSLNLAECLEHSAQRTPEKTAVILGDVRLSFAELSELARRVAGMLRARGIGRGDKVAMLLPNTPQFPIVYFGILYAGATVVSLNVLLKRRELGRQLKDSGACALFAFAPVAEECIPAFVGAPACTHLVMVEAGFAAETPAAGESFLGLMADTAPVPEMADTAPEDVAVLLYTAAEDGMAKAAVLTHFNMFQNALVISNFVFKFYPEDVCLTVLPLFHAFGQTTMMNAPLLSGGTMSLAPRFEPGRILETVARDGVTLLAMVPTMFHYVTHYKPDQHFDLSSVRMAITGGAPMPAELAEAFQERFRTPLLEGYGLTETSPVVAFNRSVETRRAGSVGQPIWGCRVGILDGEGALLPAGRQGEVAVRGHNVMRGYHNHPKATEAAFSNGWLRTGDWGYLDEDGYLYLTGLKKDMYIRAGLNVYPREIELALERHPAVREAAVVGMPDPVRGQEGLAFVVCEGTGGADEHALLAYCRAELASYKVPRRIIAVDALPRDAGGRLAKGELRAEMV